MADTKRERQDRQGEERKTKLVAKFTEYSSLWKTNNNICCNIKKGNPLVLIHYIYQLPLVESTWCKKQTSGIEVKNCVTW